MLDLQNIIPLGTSKKRKFGSVFLVKDINSQEDYILKTAKKDVISAKALLQFKNEHTFHFQELGLPQVVSFEESEQTISLLLKHKKGVGLQDFWLTIPRKKRLSFTKQFVRKVILLLEIIHSQGIYHCDLKPSNFIIEGDINHFNVHLIDFGMAIDKKNTDYLNRGIIFPLGFAAPELILNRIDLINNTTDYFALGITIYRLWAEKLPLSHINPSVFTNLQLAHPIPYESAMPKKLNNWISKVCFKPKWRTAPNLMLENEITKSLMDSFQNRYKTSEEILFEIEKVEEKKWFW